MNMFPMYNCCFLLRVPEKTPSHRKIYSIFNKFLSWLFNASKLCTTATQVLIILQEEWINNCHIRLLWNTRRIAKSNHYLSFQLVHLNIGRVINSAYEDHARIRSRSPFSLFRHFLIFHNHRWSTLLSYLAGLAVAELWQHLANMNDI